MVGASTSSEGERNRCPGRQFTGKATRLQKLPGGFSLSGGLVERDKFGTKAADTPPAERGADDAPSGRWRLHARLRGRLRGRRDDLLMNEPIDLLQSHFSLAPAEARLAFHLVAGETLRSAAVKLSISYETARTCLKSIFNKTGTCRQAELAIVILTALPGCIGAPTDRAPQKLGSNEQSLA